MRARPAIRHLVAAIALLGVLASGSSVLAGERAASGQAATDGLIVFSSLRHGNSEIYAVHGDGTGLQRLTSHASLDAFPALSPDGERIAFASTRTGKSDIYVINVDGTGLRRLTSHSAIDTEPTWSADGSRIAFTSARTGAGDIYVMSSTDGSALARVTSHSAPDTSPAWSPDGPVIAFSSLRSGLGDVYRVRADGTQLQRLTNSVAPDLFPAWSRDSERIAFSSLRSGAGDVYAMRADGTQESRITRSTAVESEPAWSPDRDRIVISSKAQGTPNVDLRIVDVSDGSSTPLASHPALDASPHWAGTDDPGPDPGGGVLLEGDPARPAADAITTFILGEGVPLAEFSVDANDTEIARTQLEIGLTPDATVGQVNSLLDSIDGRVVSMLEGVSIVLVRIADPGDLPGLDAVIATAEASPVVRFVSRTSAPALNELPSNYTDPANETKIDHHLAVRMPAAWNVRHLLDDSSKPQLVVADHFGQGPPLGEMDATLQPGDFGTGAPSAHGYHVLGIVAADYEGDSSDRGLVTGVFPDTLDVRVTDVVTGPTTRLTTEQTDNAVLAQVAASAGDVVVNTSLGTSCNTILSALQNCSESTAQEIAEVWIEKVRGMGLESKFLHVTAAGNIEVSFDTEAKTASKWAAARLLRLDVPNLTNTLVVENIRASVVECLNGGSKVGGDIAGVGTHVFSMTDAGSTAGNLDGTSMATPHVAGLAAYVWSLAPTLTPQQVLRVLLDTARPGVFDTLGELCSTSTSKPVIDAYAAVLSLDAAEPPTPEGAPIRNAVLDEDEDGRFTLADLEEFLDRYRDPLSGEPIPRPLGKDYSRHDLNGDGYTGGPDRAAFDLDREGSVQYGAPLFSDDVEQEIDGQTVTFDESAVTDLEILCYYAYSDLFDPVDSGDLLLRDDRLADYCQAADRPIVFVGMPEQNFNTEIYRVNPDGSGLTRLTSDARRDTSPKLSPDGRKIAFLRQTGDDLDIWVIGVDGSGLTRVTDSTDVADPNDRADFQHAWSPDSSKLTFYSNRDNDSAIWVVNVDGSGLTRLTEGLVFHAQQPVWSPDGSRIAFAGRELGRQSDIWVINADGTGATRLTSDATDPSPGAVDESPQWSPDSQKIAYRTSRHGNWEIHVMNADGSSDVRVTNTTAPEENIAWSPDGKIAFDVGLVNGAIYTVDPDGSNLTRLTTPATQRWELRPAWSPDGTRIAFQTNRDNPGLNLYEIYVMNANGTGQTRVTTNVPNSFGPGNAEPDW
jgi:TolB protein